MIGLANLLDVVLHQQASAQYFDVEPQPSGAVLHRRNSVQAWYSDTGSAKRQDGISTFSRRASTPLRQVHAELSEFFCVTGEHFSVFGPIKSATRNRPVTSQTLGKRLWSKVRPGRQAAVETREIRIRVVAVNKKDRGPDSKAQREFVLRLPRRQASSSFDKPARHRL